MKRTDPENRLFPSGMSVDRMAEIPVLESAEGIYLHDRNGNTYLDAIAGIAVANVGYGRTEVIEAMARQAARLPYCISNLFLNAPSRELAERLAGLAPGSGNRVHFTSGGSEANEAAIKLARQYHLANKEPSRDRIIARKTSYHGASLGALSATGMAPRRKDFLPLLADFPHIEPAYCYRCPYGRRYPVCDVQCAHALEEKIVETGPDRVMAFIAEPVVGAACGAATPPPEYFPIVREICDRYGVLLIVDEVITGMGRTGTLFAMEHWNTAPDIITLAKGLAGGYSPLGAVVVGERVGRVFEASGKPFEHVFTYGANPVSCAAGLAVVDILLKEDLSARAFRRGKYLFRQAARLYDHPAVGDIRGLGLLMGIELVRDRRSKEPFPPEFRASRRLADISLSRGLVVYPCAGSIDGERGDHLLVCPPLIVSEAECDRIVEILDDSLERLEAFFP